MGFARSPEELQGKLIDVQDCLGAMGLHVNSDKCAVLSSPECESPGVWPRGSCKPLQVHEQFISWERH